jgi:ATP-dependent exoDNAse (exonuclease V) beta subunit
VSLPVLTIIPAGAGSGKTHSIEVQLGEWVEQGEVQPERIVAVTFTEAAAAELKERIGTKLLSMGRVEDALKLEQAYISTIHGFGLRLLTEFAFESGSSPQPRLLNEDEQGALIRLASSRTELANEITANLAEYGYRYEFGSEKGPEEVFRDDLLKIVELLRSVGWRSTSTVYAEQAVAWIVERYGPTGDGAQLSRALKESVETLLAEFPQNLAPSYGTNATAETALQKDFGSLNAALKGDAVDSDWALWQRLRAMRQSKRGSALPARYDALSSDVMTAANALPTHPGPLAHARRHVEALLGAGQEVLVYYEQAKREAGLVDYSDMIALAGRLLRERPEVLATLKSRVDCVVVDEFQDTNPLQFALLWAVTAAGVPTLVVGDLKQAIMGFQGADPRLFEALAAQHSDECKPLTRNWRSQPRLMEFVNALGPKLFPEAYIALAPQRKETEREPIELVSFPTKAKKDQHRVRAAAVGERFGALLADPAQTIIDRHTKQTRRLKGGDIAVLCPTHDMLAKYADVLRAQGHRVRLQADGWYASRAVEIARYALSYLANPADRHAALYLAVTELGSLTLEQALRQLMDAGRIEDPVLTQLVTLAEGVAERTVYTLVADVIAALGLFDTVMRWPDGEQARANLLGLLAEAAEFMDANREALAYGGFHGAGVQTFLAWLAARVELKDGDRQPEPRVLDEDAIVLTTWHSAKGREWPVVAVCGLDKKIEGKLPDLGLGYASFEDLSRLLEVARIEYAPKFAAPESDDHFVVELNALAETEARRLLYVALTRARDKLVLEWPAYLAGKDTTTYWSILADGANGCGVALVKSELAVGSVKFACRVTQGSSELPDALDLGVTPDMTELPVVGRRAVTPGKVPDGLTPDSRTPSALVLGPQAAAGLLEAPADAAAAAGERVELVRYGEALAVEVGLSGVALGSLLHRALEVLGARPALADRLPQITGVAVDAAALNSITTAVARFEAWLTEHFKPTAVQREWPLLHVDARGTVVSGMADLIVHTAEGAWIVDHKSDQIEDPVQAFLKYEFQLEAYREALAATGTHVAGVAVHWIRRGDVVMKSVKTEQ